MKYMKREYIKPDINVVGVETESLLAASNFEELDTTGININTEPMSPEDALSKEHNSIWD